MTLELAAVTKRYGDQPVLHDATVRIPQGSLVVVRGPSGSGKTTLLRILGLLEPPTTGRVLVNGQDAATLADDQRAKLRLTHVGHVFQAHNMMTRLTLLENVLLPMRLARQADRARALTLLENVGLDGKADALPGEVSIGQRQRAAFARALANNPHVVIADEPTASLDDASATRVLHQLQQAHEQGKTVIVASHDPRVTTHLPGAVAWTVEEGRLRVPETPIVRA